MELKVVVSAEFGVTGEQLAHVWNVDEEGTRLAVARPVAPAELYDASEWVGQGLVVLGSLAGGVASNAIYDLLKRLLKPKAKGREITFTSVETADGTSVVQVRVTDDGRS